MCVCEKENEKKKKIRKREFDSFHFRENLSPLGANLLPISLLSSKSEVNLLENKFLFLALCLENQQSGRLGRAKFSPYFFLRIAAVSLLVGRKFFTHDWFGIWSCQVRPIVTESWSDEKWWRRERLEWNDKVYQLHLGFQSVIDGEREKEASSMKHYQFRPRQPSTTAEKLSFFSVCQDWGGEKWRHHGMLWKSYQQQEEARTRERIKFK